MDVLKQTSAVPKQERLTLLDALRGFSLLGVILMHMLQQFSIFSFSQGQSEPLFPELDEFLRWFGTNVIMGRFINIFAFLFGLSFFIQMDRASAKGVDFRGRFIWRMVILLVMGLIGNCFYGGEIISLYALFGMLLVMLYRVRSWILLLLVALLFLGTPRVLKTIYDQHAKQEQISPTAGQGQREAARSGQQVEKPSFVNAVKHNFTRGLEGKLNYQFGFYGRGYLTFGLFIVGLLVGRLRFFEVPLSGKKNRALFLVFTVICILITSAVQLYPTFDRASLLNPTRENALTIHSLMVLNDLKIVSFSAALTLGFMLLYNNRRFTRYLDVFSSYGRMGLTNYQMQGVIGCLIFSMWAFGSIFQNWGTSGLFALGIIIYILQLLFSKYWMERYQYGPLEWLWRSLTFLKAQPFKKKR